jgi:hypothetical protein
MQEQDYRSIALLAACDCEGVSIHGNSHLLGFHSNICSICLSACRSDASAKNKERWLACFNQVIGLLQNNDRVSCSFGTTKATDAGFWKHNAAISITIIYEGWFGRKYKERQDIQIADSNSFTGYSWG